MNIRETMKEGVMHGSSRLYTDLCTLLVGPSNASIDTHYTNLHGQYNLKTKISIELDVSIYVLCMYIYI